MCEQIAGPVPYSRDRLKQLFPEARVDFSRGGRFVDRPGTRRPSKQFTP